MQVDSMADASRVAAEAEAACSPLYRPPELYEPPTRTQLDGRADVWALGCVVYFLMMCINPFELACQQGASLSLAVQRCAAAARSGLCCLHACPACLLPRRLRCAGGGAPSACAACSTACDHAAAD